MRGMPDFRYFVKLGRITVQFLATPARPDGFTNIAPREQLIVSDPNRITFRRA
jgi:hypothetical protein